MKNALKIALSLVVAGTMTAACSDHKSSGSTEANIEASAGDDYTAGFAGNFLASHFAQSEYDWARANKFLDRVLKDDPLDADLIKRSMILAVGSGDMARASTRAQEVLKGEPQNGLALLVLTVNALADHKPTLAEKELKAMPEGDLTSFIKPLILGWIKAGEGQLVTTGFNDTTIHMYHAACMALMLGQTKKAREFTHKIIDAGGLGTYDAERAGDLLAALGEQDDALAIYQGVLQQTGENADLSKKIDALKKHDDSLKALLQPLQIKTPQEGSALAMYDMAFVLYQEYSDTSAKIFAQMALALNPSLIDAQLLIGDTLARNGRYDEAIAYFQSIPRTSQSYLPSQRHAADLLAEAGRRDDAIKLLEKLFNENNDVQSLIRIGDLYREDNNFGGALKVYNKAASRFGDKIPEKYWYLLYARGMTYEREGDWSKAESDLKAAMTYRPDNPYLMNYLAYGWADKGINLDQALEMIQHAVSLRPTDGYITDSLGWVLYVMGRYDEAIPHLERAVELLPYDPTINDHLGDAYWRAGRQMEAKFQWERARSNAGPEDATLKEAVARKLESGLAAPDKLKAASNMPSAADKNDKSAQ